MDFKLSENWRGKRVVEVTGEIDFEEIKDFISDVFEVDEIFPENKIIEYVESKFYPHQIFSDEELEAWAEDNGWIKEEVNNA